MLNFTATPYFSRVVPALSSAAPNLLQDLAPARHIWSSWKMGVYLIPAAIPSPANSLLSCIALSTIRCFCTLSRDVVWRRRAGWVLHVNDDHTSKNPLGKKGDLSKRVKINVSQDVGTRYYLLNRLLSDILIQILLSRLQPKARFTSTFNIVFALLLTEGIVKVDLPGGWGRLPVPIVNPLQGLESKNMMGKYWFLVICMSNSPPACTRES